jgi:hypothetical protein
VFQELSQKGAQVGEFHCLVLQLYL